MCRQLMRYNTDMISHHNKKVALGMSGGVDSSLCAHLLKEQGYEVTGIFLECWRAPGCRSEEDRKDALKVALSLNIPFQVLDFKQAYHDKVVEYFFSEYQAGRTPNPDVMCNKEIKFGLFYDWAMANGFDYVSTGHYADSQNGQLLIPRDQHKDQTYFLYRLTQNQLEHILFPLAGLTKPEVRAAAGQRKIHVADKKDSVGICFIGDINVHNFLKERLGENPGDVVDAQGNIIGRHQGLWFYTIGQRHGFDVDKHTLINQSDGNQVIKNNFPPFFVIKKNAAKNQLVVGFGTDANAQKFSITDCEWINGQPDAGWQLFVRLRHTGELLPCQLNQHQILLDQPAQGIAAGQSAVFYTPLTQNDGSQFICLGGGVIAEE